MLERMKRMLQGEANAAPTTGMGTAELPPADLSLLLPAPPVGKDPFCALCGARMQRGEDITGSRYDRSSGKRVIDYFETWVCPRWKNSYEEDVIDGRRRPLIYHDHIPLTKTKSRWV